MTMMKPSDTPPRARTSWKSWGVVIIALLSGACRGEGEPRTGGTGAPDLVLVDSVVLEETDSLFLGYPEKVFTVAGNGDFVVADEFMNHVLRFSRSGQFVRRYGRAGGGPGEFRGTLSFTMVTDSMVVQGTPSKFVAYGREDATFLFNRAHDRSFPATWSITGDSLVLGLFNFSAGKAIAVVGKSDLGGIASLTADTPPLTPDRVDFPPEYLSHRALAAFSTAYAAAWSDTMLVGFSGVPYVVRYTLAGAPVDTAWIPWRTRRGFPKGWMNVFADGHSPTLQEMVGAFSFLSGVWRLPSGDFLLWHQENAIDESQREPRFSGTPHFSVLSRDLKRACVDAPVAFPGTELPRIAVHGDTLLALDQVGDRGATSVVSVVRRYRIATEGCRWLSTDRQSTMGQVVR